MKQCYLSKLIILIAILTGCSMGASAQTSTFAYTGSIVSYVVPLSVTNISIAATGAAGGTSAYFSGGHGATITGSITVVPGHTLNIMVGQQLNASGLNAAGGGGGTFVWDVTAGNTLLVAAGGGGGGGYSGSSAGVDAVLTNNGTPGVGGYNGGGVSGNGGTTPTSFAGYTSWASGGCGWLSSGNAGSVSGTCVSGGGIYPTSTTTPGAGGAAGSTSVGAGGYGGGGGANARCGIVGAGGGGGYSGGGCGCDNNAQYQGGGGGGSYCVGTILSSSVTNTGNGSVVITVLCNGAGTISGTMSACLGATTTLTETSAGGTWSSGNTSVATIGSNGVVTGVSPGTAVISYTVSNPCGGVIPATATVTINPLPTAITGNAAACTGTTTTLNATPSAGTWTSGNTAVATVGSLTGIVTGVIPGTALITYSIPTGCGPVTKVVTVNTQPAAITGTTTVCGSLTTTLSDPTPGGTWSSNNAALATVGSNSGLVTGGAAGVAIISYTAPTGCTSITGLTVNPLSAIGGVPSMCNGLTTTLTDATPGGVWSSATPSVATIGSASGLVTSVGLGTTIVSYSIAATGCVATIPVAVTGVPGVNNVTGGGTFCTGGTGVSIGLNGSSPGVSYQLFNGGTPVPGALQIGSGLTVNFGPQTAAGTYGVIADAGTGCATPQTGSATITLLPLPTPFIVSATGGGAYCAGGAGQHILLSSSTIGVNYQLFNSFGVPIGSTVSGTGGSLDFGAITAAGVYNVTAINTSTGCSGPMSGTATITINPLPVLNTVTGGGPYCTGSADTAHIRLNGSATGTSYQLFFSGSAFGSPVAGTGLPLDFGVQPTAGTYTIVATTTATGCVATMSGSATTVVNSLPTVFTVTGGGTYCSGGVGLHVGLNSSAIGVNYQLFNGITPGAIMAGTGAALDFGLQTAAGSYTITATNTSTGCGINMFGSIPVIINPLPANFLVTASATGYCAGGTGVHILLNGSAVGVTYTLLGGGTPFPGAGSVQPGTGGTIDFGLQAPSATTTFTVLSTNATTGCANTTTSSVTVALNLLPAAFTVGGGGSYCTGGTGRIVSLSGSASGVGYLLFANGVAVPPAVTGTGVSFNFPLQTTTGSYTVVATSSTTGCTNNMTGSVTVSTTPLPVSYSVTGGGGYCTGTTTGVHVGLAASDVGINYQLVRAPSTNVGSAVSGIGGAIDFGLQTVVGTYTVVATNTATLCTSNMSGSAVISLNPLPNIYPLTTTGGSYCSGGTGVPVADSTSDVGVNYQLFNGGVAVGGPVAGTGALLNFGNQTVAGNYTVQATIAATGCTSAMRGTANVTINPLPAVFTVSSVGTTYCAGGTGVTINLSASATGFTYQLMNGAASVGTAVTGTGAALSFGLHTAGVYTVVAMNSATGCTNTMAGTITVTTTPVPTLYTISGGGAYCFGGTGVTVSLSGSDGGVNYQLLATGVSSGAPLAGTGSALNFPLQTTAGGYTILATNTTTGCTSTMIGTATVTVNPLPALHTVTGGGSYCPGTTGVDVSVDGSVTGTSYQLFNGAVAGAVMPGTGAAIDFGMQTATGTYTIVATNTSTTCTRAMTGSATVSLFPLPVNFSVTGGGGYCPGSGVDVGLSGSSAGVTYQLNDGPGIVTTLTGTGLPLDFGLQTAGTYTVTAMSVATTCTRTMSGSAVVTLNALPVTHNITGGGAYCAGSAGMDVALDGSDAGNSYQLINGITPVGAPIPGTGFGLDFGLQTAAGTYTVVATGSATGCTNVMTGSVAITVSALPTVYTVSGGGAYCAGTGGVHVGLLSSQSGISYQLFNGLTPVGMPVTGTGFPLDFGAQTAAGTYVVTALNTVTTCSKNMFGTATIVVNPLPVAFPVSGGGNYCPGSAGVHIGLDASTSGISYQLFNGFTAMGAPLDGTGSPIDFGAQTAAGTYTVVATNTATLCTNSMSNTVTVGISPLPSVYNVTSSASNYCAGSGGVSLFLSGSDAGTNYQLFVGSTRAGSPVAGTGFELDFGTQTAAGSYTVVATNASGCTGNMAGSAAIVINPLPTPYSVVGGGSYCPGGTGVHVGIAGSNTGISYQLFNDGGTPVGGPVSGTGFALDFGVQTLAGTYTVVASNPVTTCVNNMAGSVTVSISALPAAYTVTGGGNYCAGGTGVNIGLTGSNTGVTYQLYNGTVLTGSAAPGTGLALDFGMQTAAGPYTVVATNTATGCTSNMSGTVSVAVNSLPASFVVTGGGGYCPGGSGVHVGLFNSGTGVNYQLFNGTLAVGAAMPGTGVALDFGLQTTAGSYTVVATNATTGCVGTMPGSAVITLNTPPVAFNVIGGGNYCAGSTGVHIGLNGSAAGNSYQLFNGSTPEGFAVTGTGVPIDFGAQTATGTYVITATSLTTGCTGNMTGSATITVSPLVTPTVTLSPEGGDTICSGSPVTINAAITNGGATPTYSWSVNSIPVVAASGTYAYTPVAGDIVTLTLTSSAICATPSMVNASVPLTVIPHGMPSISISANHDAVCTGTSVTFTPVTAFGGSAPVLSWLVNGINVSSADVFAYTPLNGDAVEAELTSDYHCRLATNVTSNSITMEVDVPVTPAVIINADPGTHVAQGQVVLLTAAITNGVVSPSYQWLLNGEPIPGATASTYTVNSFADLDSFSCMVTSGGGCGGLTGANSAVLHTSGEGVSQVTTGGSNISLVPNPNKGIFTIKGTLGSTDDQEVTIEVSDMLGQVIYKDKVMARGGNIDQKIQLTNTLANGMYILNLRSAGANDVFHVVIEQ